MKKQTIEQIVQKYDKSLEIAKEWYFNTKINAWFDNKLEKLFPELKESEDKRIKKEIIDFLKIPHPRLVGTRDHEKWTAWLEKQGESTLIEEIKRRKELYSREKEKTVLFVENLLLGGRIATLEELLVFANEKQGEQKPILDFKASNRYVSKVDGKIHDLTYNPADDVESKFHEGDFIIHNKADIIFKVISVNSDSYYVENTKTGGRITLFNADRHFHLWTIHDVKNGDVLYYETENELRILICKDGYIHYHCCYYNGYLITVDGPFVIHKRLLSYIHPATKKQRDILFQKIKESGYKWDNRKKKLVSLI